MNDDDRATRALCETGERCLDADMRHSLLAGPSDQCLYCGAPLREFGQWCDTECKTNWEQSRARQK